MNHRAYSKDPLIGTSTNTGEGNWSNIKFDIHCKTQKIENQPLTYQIYDSNE